MSKLPQENAWGRAIAKIPVPVKQTGRTSPVNSQDKSLNENLGLVSSILYFQFRANGSVETNHSSQLNRLTDDGENILGVRIGFYLFIDVRDFSRPVDNIGNALGIAASFDIVGFGNCPIGIDEELER